MPNRTFYCRRHIHRRVKAWGNREKSFMILLNNLRKKTGKMLASTDKSMLEWDPPSPKSLSMTFSNFYFVIVGWNVVFKLQTVSTLSKHIRENIWFCLISYSLYWQVSYKARPKFFFYFIFFFINTLQIYLRQWSPRSTVHTHVQCCAGSSLASNKHAIP